MTRRLARPRAVARRTVWALALRHPGHLTIKRRRGLGHRPDDTEIEREDDSTNLKEIETYPAVDVEGAAVRCVTGRHDRITSAQVLSMHR